MYNKDFFPTPGTVARKMLARLDHKRLCTAKILEPSAGKGDLLDAVAIHTGVTGIYRKENSGKFHCLEIHPELQATLRGKGYTLVGTDFLEFWPDEKYDLILMNPPFSNGDKHLLHAWEILEHGDIICLLNEQTIKNQYSASRSLLAELIEQHGEVESLGACFEDAFRKTSVNVSLVHLHKEAAAFAFDFEAGPDFDPYTKIADSEFLNNEIATRDIIGNLVADYDRCRELFLEISSKVMELGLYMGRFSRTVGADTATTDIFSKACEHLLVGEKTRERQQDAYNTFVRGLKKNAWTTVFQLTRFGNLVSDKVRSEIEKLQEENQRMAFSRSNISNLLELLLSNREHIMNQCVIDAFDLLTRYHEENRVHVEGWKTNDSWKVNRRAVLPVVIDCSWCNPTLNYRRERELNDIERGIAFLDGKSLDQVPETICSILKEALKSQGYNALGKKLQSTYFELKAFKKGTLHMYFKDADLWEQFNIMAAKGKNWLPDDYKARHKEEKARNKWADSHGLTA